MKQVLVKKGQAVIEEVPAPQTEAGRVLVKLEHSCISIGTEMSGVHGSGMPLWKRALKQPENVKKVFNMIYTQGLARTKNIVQGKLDSGNPTGYSAAGIIIDIGDGINDLKIGDRVACAGAQCAFHAEYISVPRNLTVAIPSNVSLKEASSVTLGAIAMQGVRRANPTLGETIVVIGLGVLGQLTVQMLKANGCRVIATDLDRSRIDMALKSGADYGIHPDDSIDIEQVARITGGIGADGVIITAATQSDAVVSTAFKMCRRKGRVVLVGDVGLHLNRADFYNNEIDFFISTSYGPGRYDDHYEEKGFDYPVAYVRWTENRNMEEYLRLLGEKKVQITPMIQGVYPIEQATDAYEKLKDGQGKPLIVLFSYPPDNRYEKSVKVLNPMGKPTGNKKVSIAVVGAGGFAKGMHLPNLQSLNNLYHLQAVMSRTGHNAMSTVKQFNVNYATTDYHEILNDKEVDAVLIATRHNLHANMVLQALQAGKNVLVEKPLAINTNELQQIVSFYEKDTIDKPILLTGFNRRFSQYARSIHNIVSNRTNPMIINYRMNAGYIPLDHWVHTEEGAGRNIGEACHIYDLFNYLTGSKVINVHAQSLIPSTGHYSAKDNFIATISFEDGSVATLTYTALGAKEYPKEHMEVYCDGKTIVMEDYKKMSIFGGKAKSIDSKISEKGQKEEVEAFANCILQSGEWPISLWQQVQAMEIAFKVEKCL